MSIINEYLRGIKEQSGYFGAWLPNVPIQTGMYGPIVDRIFTPIGSLADFGIPLQEEDGAGAVLSYTSGNDVSFATNASGAVSTNTHGVPGSVSADIAVSFAKAGGFLFHAMNATAHVLTNLAAISSWIVEKHQNRAWDQSWYIVREVVIVDDCMIAISNSKQSTIRFKGNAHALQPTAAHIDLAAGFVGQSSGMLTFSMQGGQPLFRVCRFRKSFFSLPGLMPISDRGFVEKDVIEEPMIEFLRGVAEPPPQP